MSDDEVVISIGDVHRIDVGSMTSHQRGVISAVADDWVNNQREVERLAQAYNDALEELGAKDRLLNEKEDVIADLRRGEHEDVAQFKQKQKRLIESLQREANEKAAALSDRDCEMQLVNLDMAALQGQVSALQLQKREVEQAASREVEDLQARAAHLTAENTARLSELSSLKFTVKTLQDERLMLDKELGDTQKAGDRLKAEQHAAHRAREADAATFAAERREMVDVIEGLRAAREELERDLSDARLREKAAVHEADGLREDLKLVKMRGHAELSDQAAAHAAELAEKARQLADAQAETSSLDAQLAERGREVHAQTREIHALQAAVQEATQKERLRRMECERLGEDAKQYKAMLKSESARLQDQLDEVLLKNRDTLHQLQQQRAAGLALESRVTTLDMENDELKLENTRHLEDVRRLKDELDAIRKGESQLRIHIKKLEMVLSQKDSQNEMLKRKLQEGEMGLDMERQDVERLTDAVQSATDRLRMANKNLEEIFENGGTDAGAEDGEDLTTSRAADLMKSLANMPSMAADEDYSPACLPEEVEKVETFADQLLALLEVHTWEQAEKTQNADDDAAVLNQQHDAAIKELEDKLSALKRQGEADAAARAAAGVLSDEEQQGRRETAAQEDAAFGAIVEAKRAADAYLTRARLGKLIEEEQPAARDAIAEAEEALFTNIVLRHEKVLAEKRAEAVAEQLRLIIAEADQRAAVKEAEEAAARAIELGLSEIRNLHWDLLRNELQRVEEPQAREDIVDHEKSERNMLLLKCTLEEERRKVEAELRLRKELQDKVALEKHEERERVEAQNDESQSFQLIKDMAAELRVAHLGEQLEAVQYNEEEGRLDLEDLEEAEWNNLCHEADGEFDDVIEKLRKRRLLEMKRRKAEMAKKTAYMGLQVSDGITLRGIHDDKVIDREKVSRMLKDGMPVDLKAQQRVEGVKVFSVAANGPADIAGISDQDIILKLNLSHTRSLADFKQAAKKVKPGERVNFVVWRDGEQVALAVQTVEVNEDDFEQGLQKKVKHKITVLKTEKEQRAKKRAERRQALKSSRGGEGGGRGGEGGRQSTASAAPSHAPSLRRNDDDDEKERLMARLRELEQPEEGAHHAAATHTLAGANAGPLTQNMFNGRKRVHSQVAADYEAASLPFMAAPESARGEKAYPQ